MAVVLDFAAQSSIQTSQGAPPQTRNQELLERVVEALAARTLQELLGAQIAAVDEELKHNRLRYADLVERKYGLVRDFEMLTEHGEMSGNQAWSDNQRDDKIRELFDTAQRASAGKHSDDNAIIAEIVHALLVKDQAYVAGQPEDAWAAFRRECWSFPQEVIEQVLDEYKARAASVAEMEGLKPAVGGVQQSLDQGAGSGHWDEPAGPNCNAFCYVGYRNDDGVTVNKIGVDGRTAPLPMRNELRNHSPTGPEWGYIGSGPAQLALAILCDAVGDDAALSCYQDYKFDVVCALPTSWEMRRHEVAGWYAHHRSNSETGDLVVRAKAAGQTEPAPAAEHNGVSTPRREP